MKYISFEEIVEKNAVDWANGKVSGKGLKVKCILQFVLQNTVANLIRGKK